MRLTTAGQRYLEAIDPAIRQIQAATESLLRPSGRNVVRLTLPPSLAATWLIPQLSAFEREHPDIELQLVPTTRVIDLRRDQVDLAIRHGKGSWPGVEAAFLLDETALPVGPDISHQTRAITSATLPCAANIRAATTASRRSAAVSMVSYTASVVHARFVDPDYRTRMAIDDMLAALRSAR